MSEFGRASTSPFEISSADLRTSQKRTQPYYTSTKRCEQSRQVVCDGISPSDPPVTTPSPFPHQPSTQTASTIPHLSPVRQQSSPQCKNLLIGARLRPKNRESYMCSSSSLRATARNSPSGLKLTALTSPSRGSSGEESGPR